MNQAKPSTPWKTIWSWRRNPPVTMSSMEISSLQLKKKKNKRKNKKRILKLIRKCQTKLKEIPCHFHQEAVFLVILVSLWVKFFQLSNPKSQKRLKLNLLHLFQSILKSFRIKNECNKSGVCPRNCRRRLFGIVQTIFTLIILITIGEHDFYSHNWRMLITWLHEIQWKSVTIPIFSMHAFS